MVSRISARSTFRERFPAEGRTLIMESNSIHSVNKRGHFTFSGLAGACPYANVHTVQLPSLCRVWKGGLALSGRARVQRGPSEAARCVSTGNRQASLLSILFSLFLIREIVLEGVAKVALDCAHRTSTVLSCAFCEQGGHLAAPFLTLLRPRVERARKIIRPHPLSFSSFRDSAQVRRRNQISHEN